MFFSISHNKDLRLPNHHELTGALCFSCDDGWHDFKIDNHRFFFKGYCDELSTVDLMAEFLKDPTPRYHGNFCMIISNANGVTITHDLYRSFNLWMDKELVLATNFDNIEFKAQESVYADEYLTIENGFRTTKFDVLGSLHTKQRTFTEAVDAIEELLLKKVEYLRDKKIKVFVTGGVDTMLLYSLLRNQNIDHEFIDYEHFEYDKFTYGNIKYIKQRFWGYNQMHHWVDDTLFMTGSCGDEYFLRGPALIAQWAAWHGRSVLEEISPNDYHYEYFLKNKNVELFVKDISSKIQKEYPTREELYKQILNVNVNDHQWWHLGNTLTWTPFKDLEITKIILSMAPNDIFRQMLSGDINFELIRRFDKTLLPYISDHKNITNLSKLAEIC